VKRSLLYYHPVFVFRFQGGLQIFMQTSYSHNHTPAKGTNLKQLFLAKHNVPSIALDMRIWGFSWHDGIRDDIGVFDWQELV
jgi:hypothetical protein